MRLWTLHPRYLDAAGLVAVWRESLLAQTVLRGHTRGYKHHPQLARFRAAERPIAAIGSYLEILYEEATRRGYSFDRGKIGTARLRGRMEESRGQLLYEWRHLRRKLKRRSPAKYKEIRTIRAPAAHPLFRIAPGRVRDWERRK